MQPFDEYYIFFPINTILLKTSSFELIYFAKFLLIFQGLILHFVIVAFPIFHLFCMRIIYLCLKTRTKCTLSHAVLVEIDANIWQASALGTGRCTLTSAAG